MPKPDTHQIPVRPFNRLLHALPVTDFDKLRPFLDLVPLTIKSVLLKPDQIVDEVHFPECGTVSMIATLEDGARIEVGMVGSEGMVGLPLLLGARTSSLEGMVQIEGEALRLPSAAFRNALREIPALLPLLLRYVDSYQLLVAQSAACNGRHDVVQRLARWLLTTQDKVQGGSSFFMTHEFISTMLGVRRPGVTLALATLRRAGLVDHRRSHIQVLDRVGLEAASCECYNVVRRRFAWLTEDAAGQSMMRSRRPEALIAAFSGVSGAVRVDI